MLLTVNLANRPQDEEVEVVGFGIFPNGHTYELGQEGDDVVVGKELDSSEPPVKESEMVAQSEDLKSLLRKTHAELDELAEQYKVTFDEGMTKEEKAKALLGSTEGDD